VLARLATERCADVVAPTRTDVDLRDAGRTSACFREARPDVVVHLAARVGGIGANERLPGTFWRDNLLMGVNVLEACRVAAVGRLVVVGTVCSYPKHTPVPFREADLWSGFPEETNAPYGVAKRALATGMDAYRREFGLAGAFLLPANLYGPGDDFDDATSHVIAATVRKCVEAVESGRTEISMWGTGAATREFLFVDDAADAVARAAASIDDPAPMNLGTGREISIRDLAVLIGRATGFTGRFAWDPRRPDGQPRRALDTSEALRRLGWVATTALEDGLAATVRGYREARTRNPAHGGFP
jgi:GDP-L-fucose synthase